MIDGIYRESGTELWNYLIKNIEAFQIEKKEENKILRKSHNINLPSIFTQLNINLPSTQRSYAGLRAFS